MTAPRPLKRTRLAPEARRAQILDAAAQMLLDQGVLPLPLEALSRTLQVSKPLIYSYFPSQFDLVNALLARSLAGLLEPLGEAAQIADLHEAARRCADIYFDHVAENGPLLHVLFSDPYAVRQLDPILQQQRAALMLRLARRIRTAARLPAEEILAGLNLLIVIPEEAGVVAFRKVAPKALCRELCREQIGGALSALLALRPAARSAAA
jgi:AcrR family transcriptional regulator